MTDIERYVETAKSAHEPGVLIFVKSKPGQKNPEFVAWQQLMFPPTEWNFGKYDYMIIKEGDDENINRMV